MTYYNPEDFDMEMTGSKGREKYVLRYKGRVVGRGDLRKMVAKSNGRQRLEQFEQKNSALPRAEARVRRFALTSRLTETP